MDEILKNAPHWRALAEEKMSKYQGLNTDLSHFHLDIHTASWCPDCEREITELMALIWTLKDFAPSLNTIQHYENKDEYKQKKQAGVLNIKAVPTIIIKDANKLEINRIEEVIDGPLIEYFK